MMRRDIWRLTLTGTGHLRACMQAHHYHRRLHRRACRRHRHRHLGELLASGLGFDRQHSWSGADRDVLGPAPGQHRGQRRRSDALPLR